MEKEYKYQTVEFTIVSGTSALDTANTISLEKEFKTVEGFTVVDISGSNNYNIGLRPNRTGKAWVDRSHKSLFIASTAVGKSDRFTLIGTEVPNVDVVIEIEPNAAFGTDQVIQVIFLLSKQAKHC